MIMLYIIQKIRNKIYNYNFNFVSINIVNLMLGFFLANVLSTLPAQTEDWNIIGAAIIVTINEITSKIIYRYKKFNYYIIHNIINNIKIGIIYGLFVDAFKLGS